MANLRVPPGGGSPRDVAFLLTQLLNGKIASVGTMTLTSSTTLTTVFNPLVSGESRIMLTPASAAAATEPVYISTQAAGSSFTVSHSNGASATDRVFYYVILG